MRLRRGDYSSGAPYWSEGSSWLDVQHHELPQLNQLKWTTAGVSRARASRGRLCRIGISISGPTDDKTHAQSEELAGHPSLSTTSFSRCLPGHLPTKYSGPCAGRQRISSR
jgi:hypothetical protein